MGWARWRQSFAQRRSALKLPRSGTVYVPDDQGIQLTALTVALGAVTAVAARPRSYRDRFRKNGVTKRHRQIARRYQIYVCAEQFLKLNLQCTQIE